MTGPVGSRHDRRRGAGGPGAHAKTRAGPAGAPGGRADAALPTGFGVVIDPGTKQLDRVTLFGGAPARVLRLSRAGRTALAELRAGPVRGAAAGRLARKLTDAGLAHPRPPELASRPDVTVLIPVRDRAVLLDRCLSALGSGYPVVVVDDGSRDPGRDEDRDVGPRSQLRRPRMGQPGVGELAGQPSCGGAADRPGAQFRQRGAPGT